MASLIVFRILILSPPVMCRNIFDRTGVREAWFVAAPRAIRMATNAHFTLLRGVPWTPRREEGTFSSLRRVAPAHPGPAPINGHQCRGQRPALWPQSEGFLKGHPRSEFRWAGQLCCIPISASAQSCIPPCFADTAARSAPEAAICWRPGSSVSVSWLHPLTELVKADCVKWQLPSVFLNGHNCRDACKMVLRILYAGRAWASTNQSRGLCDQPAHLDQGRQASWIFQQLANSFPTTEFWYWPY